MKVNSIEDESHIASAGAKVLHESFIENARTNTVLYVENDAIWSKSPNSIPVLIKQLSGRNPDLAKKILGLGTFRIKKQSISPSNE
ncbi:hypothetical protein MXM33_07305 [Acinetobacter vivianii]|uniref:hypothetical protein n=1 Tax=Acinetobacter vivianii TaxID=1776742 RepID=UPI002DB9C7D1|nr:hypothetical protein [Acinetobacter vivianii]MEB6666838.1 hypothetical protein [Acinetobacter vivianii]